MSSPDYKNVYWHNVSPLWDSFKDPPINRSKGSAGKSKKLEIGLKIFKFLVYVFVFAIVLLSAATSNLLFVTMSAQLRSENHIRLCHRNDDRQFSVKHSREEQFAWMWALIIAFGVPEFLTFFRSARICLFKDVGELKLKEILMISLPELLHTLGIAALSFAVFPHLHPISALALCNCVSLIPALIDIPVRAHLTFRSILNNTLSILALIAQLSSCVLLIFSDSIIVQIAGIPLILVSFRWWENYVQLRNYGREICKNFLNKTKYKIYLYLSPIKVVVFAMFGFFMRDASMAECIQMFPELWRLHTISMKEVHKHTYNGDFIFHGNHGLVFQSKSNAVLSLLCFQVMCSYLCYITAKFACKVQIQKFSLILPLSLASPVAFIIAVTFMQLRGQNICGLQNIVDYYLLLPSEGDHAKLPENQIALWVLWWASQLWIQRHMLSASADRNAPTERLFVCPWYSGLLVTQCVAMNYRVQQKNEGWSLQKDEVKKSDVPPELLKVDPDKIPQLIICATMWHETQDEMMEFLKSIIRLDEDQCARRMAKTYINGGEPDCDYYELETNIFFDDAFVADKTFSENSKNPPLNDYTRTLITSIDKAASEVLGTEVKVRPPVKIETPYGGRLVWTLPGRSKLIAHLKNKDKVRHKKRWSQVMYMYYLLGFRIMELENVSLKRKALIAENTYLLALDGDIDFQPQAVQLLIDRMKVIDELGAACGRIHPVGRGPMVWYQIFEYSIGHWLQKATEHIIGCVLCSPGCFSLFRGSALMENSVMKKYTRVSKKPLDYIQYDQGEDRWLCTLLLKQGLRVEYSAASDAYTHSPETFNEFYNQRRRWIPSTIANIFDLLSDAKLVVKNNSSISSPYIWYQIMLMIGTVLGPGTIFLMMVGAFVTVFKVNIWTAFLWNFFPVFGFILFCIYLKQKFQLVLAFGISTLYCLIMMAVLIGIIIQIIDDGPLAPASVFFLIVFCQIVIAGLVHPQEVSALFCGVIYYITIPSMYMLLLIYSVFNMNDVSWGTRETVERKENNEGPTISAENGSENQNENTLSLPDPGWVNDPLLLESALGEISLKEKRFWKDLTNSYLKPLYQSQKDKNEVVSNLRELRNFCAFAFFMINALFVLVVFLLQLHKDYLHLDWPIGALDHITFDDLNSQIYIYRKYKELDPIGLCFVLFFGLILIIQFIAMFVHRFMTISQILAATHLNWFQFHNLTIGNSATQDIRGNAVDIARCLQKPLFWEDKNLCIFKQSNPGSDSFTEQEINQFNERKKSTDYCDLQKNFEKRFLEEDETKLSNLLLIEK